MTNQNQNDQALTDKDGRRQDNYGRRSGDRRTETSAPGGDGSQERVPAKGNDITREDDLLQTDIADEVDDVTGSVSGRMREVERKREDEGQEVMQDKPRNPDNAG